MRQRSPKLFPLLKRGNNLTKLGAPTIEAENTVNSSWRYLGVMTILAL